MADHACLGLEPGTEPGNQPGYESHARTTDTLPIATHPALERLSEQQALEAGP